MEPDTKILAKRFTAVHSEVGTTTETGYFGLGPQMMFGCLLTPARALRGSVIICPPVHADAAKSYRSEVVLARALAHQGFGVLRFHYRGQGHSDGDSSMTTFESMREDVIMALSFLRSRIETSRFALIGCRLGGLVAAAVASLHDSAPLVLWEPVLEPRLYLREAIRARLIGDLSTKGTPSDSPSLRIDQLQEGESIDIHGYPIHGSMVRSLEGRTLFHELGGHPRPILLIQVGKGQSLGAANVSFLERLSALGFPVDVQLTGHEIGWWFRGASQDRERSDQVTDVVVAATVSWLHEQFSPQGAPR